MKVVYVIDHLGRGGAQQALFDLVSNLSKPDFETAIISLRRDTQLARKLRSLGHRVETLGLSKFSLFAMRTLRSAINQFEPTIVHTHLDFSNTFAARAALAEGVPIVIRHDHSGSWSRNRRYFIKRFLLERLAGSATHVVAVSNGVKEFNVSLGVDPSRITVIYNGVDITRFTPPHSRGKDAPAGAAPIVGFVGRLSRCKGLTNLIAAAPSILKQFPSASFVIIGEGPEGRRLKKKVAKAGLEGAFIWLGHQPEPEKFYPDFNVVVMPSINEAFPLVALEAMATARPVVASRVGGLAEVIENGVNGFLVQSAHSRLLADQVCRLLLDEELAQKIGNEARRRVERHYALEANTGEIIDLYLRLSSKHGCGHKADQKLRVI